MTIVRVACARLLLMTARRISIVALACLGLPSIARGAPPGFTVTPVHTGLSFPVAFRFTPDGRLLYLERIGRVMVFDSDADPTPGVWATIPTNATSDRGLLGIALHPSFPDSPYVYFYHCNPSPLVDRVVRLRDQGATGNGTVIIRDGIPATNNSHHGGRLAFASDGTLWLTYGEQNDPAAAQDPSNIRGKLLRFTPMGQDAPGNPFGPGIVMGIRNSFGICFDPVTGNGYFTDNGPTCDDELNLIEVGANYGWGPSDTCGGQPAGTRLPLASFTPPFAPTSCVVYRGSTAPLYGNLFFGGYVDGSIRRVYFRAGSNGTEIDSIVVFHQIGGAHVLDVIVGNDGNLWFSTTDAIYRIDPPPPPAAVGEVGIAQKLRMAPNPFLESVTIFLGLPGTSDRLEILDLGGRSVRRWETSDATVTWDGRDESGRDAPPGLYMIRAVGKGRVAKGRLMRIGRR